MILANYVRKQAFFSILFAVIGLLILKLLFDYLAQLDNLDENYNFVQALYYIAYQTPEALQKYMASGALLGGVIGLGLLANHSELTVMQASGLSRFKIVSWVIQPAIIFVLIGLAISQFVVPTTNQLAKQIKHDNPTMLTSAINGYWHKQDNQIVSIDYADTTGNLKNIKLWQLDNHGELHQIITAKTGTYHTNGWQLSEVSQLTIQNDQRSHYHTSQQLSLKLPIDPTAIYLFTRQPDDMSMSDLWQHQQFLQRQQRRSLEHEVVFWQKILSPFAVLSLVLVACSFVFGSLRSQSLGFRIIIAILFGLVFSYLQDLVGFISLSTGFSPLLMVLLPIIISAILGIYLIKTKN